MRSIADTDCGTAADARDPLHHLRSKRRQRPAAPSATVEAPASAPLPDHVQSASESEQGESAVDWHDVVTEGSASSATPTVSSVVADDGGFVVSVPAQVRYLHTVVPICLVLLSTLVSLFFGSFGPFSRTATGFMYFHMLCK